MSKFVALGPILGAASTGLSVYSAISGAREQASAAKANAAAAARNAEIERRNAQQARIAADRAAMEERKEGRIRIGKLRASIGASGVTISGSPLLAVAEQAKETELEAQKLLEEGEFKAAGFESQAQLDDLESSRQRSKASSAITAGYINAGTSLLTGTKSLLN